MGGAGHCSRDRHCWETTFLTYCTAGDMVVGGFVWLHESVCLSAPESLQPPTSKGAVPRVEIKFHPK